MSVYSIWLVDPLSVTPSDVEVLYPIWTLKNGKMVDCWNTIEGAREHFRVRDNYNDWYYANRFIEHAKHFPLLYDVAAMREDPLYGTPEPAKPEGWDCEETEKFYAILRFPHSEFKNMLLDCEDSGAIFLTVSIDDIFNQEDFL